MYWYVFLCFLPALSKQFATDSSVPPMKHMHLEVSLPFIWCWLISSGMEKYIIYKKNPLNFEYFVVPKCQVELPSVRSGHLCFKVVNSTCCSLINLLLNNLILTFYLVQLDGKNANMVTCIYRYTAAYWETTSHRLVLLHVCTVSLKSFKIYLFFMLACFRFSYLLQPSAKSQIKFLSCLYRTCHEPYRTGSWSHFALF